MIRAEALRLAFASLLATAVLSLSAPAAAQDPRIVTRVFEDDQVVTISGKVKVQSTIKFAPDEQIENVAIGDSGAWQVQPNKAQTILFVKPLAVNAKTNMTVVTDKRTYLFDLVASPRNMPIYVLQFRYPKLEARREQERLAAEAEAKAQAERAEQALLEPSPVEVAAADDPFAVQDPAKLNFDWAAKGDSNLLPSTIYDNGEAVFLTWPQGASIPAILVTNENGEEGPVNFIPRGDTVVLDMVPAQIILRSGDETATLTNNGPVRSARADSKGARGS